MKTQLILALTLLTAVSGIFAEETAAAQPQKSKATKYVLATAKFVGAAGILGLVIVPWVTGVKTYNVIHSNKISADTKKGIGMGLGILKSGVLGTFAGLLIASGINDLQENNRRVL